MTALLRTIGDAARTGVVGVVSLAIEDATDVGAGAALIASGASLTAAVLAGTALGRGEVVSAAGSGGTDEGAA
jgi:hypothetical protein